VLKKAWTCSGVSGVFLSNLLNDYSKAVIRDIIKKIQCLKLLLFHRYVEILNDTHKMIGISFSIIIAALFSLLGVRVSIILLFFIIHKI